MRQYRYGQQPSDIPERLIALGWLRGVRHLKSDIATESLWHSHGQLQILYCIRGEFGYTFEGRPDCVLTAGHFLAIPARLRHRHRDAIDPTGHRVELLVDPAGRGPHSTLPRAVVRQLVDGLVRRICAPVACSKPMGQLFAELDAIATRFRRASPDPVELSRFRTLACQMLLAIGTDEAPSAPHPETRLMDDVLAWLERHFREKLSISSLVAYMGYSRAHLFTLFKARTGLTPADWIQRRRVREACGLLARPGAKTADIAAACGFDNVPYFRAVFRKLTGLTPRQWRVQNGKT